MTESNQTEDVSFDKIASDILEDAKSDRVRFLEVIDGMESLASKSPEVGIAMMEHIVRGYDVLNKMNAARATLAALALKKRSPVENEGRDLFDEIGDISGRVDGASH